MARSCSNDRGLLQHSPLLSGLLFFSAFSVCLQFACATPAEFLKIIPIIKKKKIYNSAMSILTAPDFPQTMLPYYSQKLTVLIPSDYGFASHAKILGPYSSPELTLFHIIPGKKILKNSLLKIKPFQVFKTANGNFIVKKPSKKGVIRLGSQKFPSSVARVIYPNILVTENYVFHGLNNLLLPVKR